MNMLRLIRYNLFFFAILGTAFFSLGKKLILFSHNTNIQNHFQSSFVDDPVMKGEID